MQTEEGLGVRELQKCLGEAGEEGGRRRGMASKDFPVPLSRVAPPKAA